jgi:hypothetical protein
MRGAPTWSAWRIIVNRRISSANGPTKKRSQKPAQVCSIWRSSTNGWRASWKRGAVADRPDPDLWVCSYPCAADGYVNRAGSRKRAIAATTANTTKPTDIRYTTSRPTAQIPKGCSVNHRAGIVIAVLIAAGARTANAMRALPAGRENAGSFEPVPPVSGSLGTSGIGVEISSPKKKLLSHFG